MILLPLVHVLYLFCAIRLNPGLSCTNCGRLLPNRFGDFYLAVEPLTEVDLSDNREVHEWSVMLPSDIAHALESDKRETDTRGLCAAGCCYPLRAAEDESFPRPLRVGAVGRLVGLVRSRVERVDGVIPEDPLRVVPVLGLDPRERRPHPREERSVEVRELDAGHGRRLGSGGHCSYEDRHGQTTPYVALQDLTPLFSCIPCPRGVYDC